MPDQTAALVTVRATDPANLRVVGLHHLSDLAYRSPLPVVLRTVSLDGLVYHLRRLPRCERRTLLESAGDVGLEAAAVSEVITHRLRFGVDGGR